ncbi:MAG: hypothetical protein IJH77_03990, partial [Mogibacterium sp.]|nr:hypothetical protein [Mogibacterium sp.]
MANKLLRKRAGTASVPAMPAEKRKRRKAPSRFERMELKNGIDVPEGTPRPVTGRKRELIRSYELLVLKTDEAYEAEAAEQAKRRRAEPAAPAPLSAVPAAQSGAGELAEAAIYPEESGLQVLSEAAWRRKRRRKRLAILGALIAILVAVAARLLYGDPILVADISQYEDVTIEVEGLTEEPFTITAAELRKLPKTAIHVETHQGELAEGEVPEYGRALGPSLDTFLEYYTDGITTEDLRSMKVYTEKGSSTAYVKTMTEELNVLSIANGNRPLAEKLAP